MIVSSISTCGIIQPPQRMGILIIVMSSGFAGFISLECFKQQIAFSLFLHWLNNSQSNAAIIQSPIIMTSTDKEKNELSQKIQQYIPSFLRFNPRIVRGYRVGYNIRALFKSLFEWHNETVNAWTHLIGALVIFFIIFSSNLFTQHYHSKHELLDVRDALQHQQGNLTEIYERMIPIHHHDSQTLVDQGLFNSLLKTLPAIEREINAIIRLTQDDGLIYRNHIINQLQQFIQIKENIQELISRSFLQKGKLSDINMQQLYAKLQTFRLHIHQVVAQIISLIEKLAENVNPIPKWPLLVFFFAASICLTFSFTFHLFHPHSQGIYRLLRKLDFSGVILLIVGSSFPLLVYGANCASSLANIYLCIMSIIGLTAFGLLVSGYFDPRSRQKKKSMLFGLFGVSFLIPLLHFLILQRIGEVKDSMSITSFMTRVLTFGGIYLLGLFIYTVQCPQRYVQGKFDYCGASHQIWHLSVLIALYITYELSWDLYYQRRMNPCLCV